jgi:hypothetical protein
MEEPMSLLSGSVAMKALVLSLAVAPAAFAIAHTGLFERLRTWAAGEKRFGLLPSVFLCDFCLSFWVSVVFCWGVMLFPFERVSFLVWLATWWFSGVQCVLMALLWKWDDR